MVLRLYVDPVNFERNFVHVLESSTNIDKANIENWDNGRNTFLILL